MIKNLTRRLVLLVAVVLLPPLHAGIFKPIRTGFSDPYINIPVDWDSPAAWQTGGPPNATNGTDSVIWDVNRFLNGQLSTLLLNHDVKLGTFTYYSRGSQLVSSNQLNVTTMDWLDGALAGEGELHLGGVELYFADNGALLLFYPQASTFAFGQHDLGDWALVNHGHAIWSDGAPVGGSAKSFIHNQQYAEFDLQTVTNFSVNNWPVRFLNEGSVIKSGVNTQDPSGSYINFEQFENRGTVTVNGGALGLDGDATNTGAYFVSTGAQLTVTGTSYTGSFKAEAGSTLVLAGQSYADTVTVTSDGGNVYLGSGNLSPAVFDGELISPGTNYFRGVRLTPKTRIRTWGHPVFNGLVRFETGHPQTVPSASFYTSTLEGADPLVFTGPSLMGNGKVGDPFGISETTLGSTGGIVFRGDTRLDGVMTFVFGTNVNIRGYLWMAGSQVRNEGNLSTPGMPLLFSEGGLLLNAPGASMSWNGQMIVQYSPFADTPQKRGLWVNEGLVDLTLSFTSGFSSQQAVEVPFQQRGELLLGGNYTVDWGTNFTQFAGHTKLVASTLRGSPLNFVSGTLTGFGVIGPSFLATNSDALVLGSEATTEIRLRTPGSIDPDGAINPNAADLFDVRGTVQLGGVLAVTALPSFGWNRGDRFEVLRFASRGDTRFARYAGLSLAGGAFLAPTITETNLVLEVVNDHPVAVEDNLTLLFADSFTVPVADLLANDFNPGGGPLTLTAVTEVSDPEVTVTLDASADLPTSQLIIAGPARFRPLSFTYTIANDQGQTASALVTLAPVRRTTLQRDEQNGLLTLRFEGLPEAHYAVEFSSLMEGADWHFLAEAVADETGLVSFTETFSADPQRFYRFRAL